MAVAVREEPIAARKKEQRKIEAVAEIAEHAGGLRLVAPDGSEVELPESLRTVLTQAAHQLLRGSRVSLVALHTLLTTQQAAELLNVSRPYLIRLLERGDLPFEYVGTHRRLRIEDVLRYRQERSRRRREALRRLSQEADELGIYAE
jgi:excisionase family DNA binding protein